jgi:hypothetical protein
MKMRGRILRLETRLGVSGDEEMTDTELLHGLRRMFRADPERRWEEELPAMGWGLSQVLAEERAAGHAGAAT